MSEPTPRELVEMIEPLAVSAGERLMRRFRELRPSEIEFKGRRNLVSVADRESESFIKQEISRRYPSHRVLGEEFGGGDGDGEWLWYVDPLDGTTNFVHGHPIFCVSIAVARAGRLLAGVVHAPALGETYAAAEGGGARRNGTPIRVSPETDLSHALLATGFPYALDTLEENNLRYFDRFSHRALAIRRCGAAAIDLAWVASGVYDGFWELGLHPWDVAAGALLVREAGGRVSDLAGGDAFLESGRIAAANQVLHGSILKVLEESGAGRSAGGRGGGTSGSS
jgi:myo-inositol-1(or 4)-monophosphatase